MIQSIFILSGDAGDVILEKHYKGVTPRTSVDVFWEEVTKRAKRDDVPPILVTSKYYLVNVFRGGLYFLAALTGEMPALSVVEFLHRVYDVFFDYFGEVSQRSLTDNFSTAYQLLEEMVDNGHPLITEANALVTLIAPPSIAGKLTAFFIGKASGISETIGDGAMSIIPWRRSGCKYAQNEIFFDIIEEVDVIYEANGTAVAADVRGTVQCVCHLSGTPDLTLVFNAPGVIEDCAFHPCVRYARWERENVVSFVPPDGPFTLMTYRITEKAPALPLYARPSVSWRDGGARASVTVGTKPLAMRSGGGSTGAALVGAGDLSVEEVMVRLTFPRAVKSVDLSSDVGSTHTDPRTNELTWYMSRLPRDRSPELAGNVYLAPGANAPVEAVSATLSFTCPNVTVSGLNVRDLILYNEKYKMFKGVRTVLKAGRIQLRT